MTYAIGDIHGHLAALETALALVEAEAGPEAEIVFLGDLVDRGPDSRGVIDRLMGGIAEGRNWRVVFGNHDRMFLRFVTQAVTTDPAIKSGKGWLHPALGGPMTLASYLPGMAFDHPDWDGVETFLRDGLDGGDRTLVMQLVDAAREAIPQAHIDWINSAPRLIETEDYLFVHAGIRPGVAIADQVEDDLIWIREGWLDDTRDHGKLVVHGHTALDYPVHHGNRVNVDGGAGFGRTLVPVAIEGRDAWALSPEGRRELVPQTS